MSKDNFYEELDQDKYDTHHFAIYLVVIFISIVVLGSILSIWLVNQAKSRLVGQGVSTSLNLETAKSQFLSFLPFTDTSSQSTTVTLNDDQLTSLLNASDKSGEDNRALQDITAIINPENITINGLLVNPVKTHVQLKVLPVVSQGELRLDILSVKVASINLPGLLKKSLTPTVNKLTLKTLNSDSINYKSIELSNHLMTLKGKEK